MKIKFKNWILCTWHQHKILSEDKLKQVDKKLIINLVWHIAEEIKNYLIGKKLKIRY